MVKRIKPRRTSHKKQKLTAEERGALIKKGLRESYGTEAARTLFLEKYRETARNDLAAAHAGINITTFFHWKQTDPEFRAAYQAARDATIHLLEDAAHRRAIKGVKRAVYYRGDLVDYERQYSDTLLMFLMKSNAPERYGDKAEHTLRGPDGPIKSEVTHRGLSDEAIADLRTRALGLKK